MILIGANPGIGPGLAAIGMAGRRKYLNRTALCLAVGAMVISQLTMVGVMAMTPVHLRLHGHEGVRQLACMLGEELHEHHSFEYTYRAVEGRMAFLEWAYEDDNVRVRDGADSYLIEKGKIVAQTIHYTVEQK